MPVVIAADVCDRDYQNLFYNGSPKRPGVALCGPFESRASRKPTPNAWPYNRCPGADTANRDYHSKGLASALTPLQAMGCDAENAGS